MSSTALNLLKQHKLRKTATRLQVLELFLDSDHALSHQHLESNMDEADRVTLYRTLKTFEQKGLIHKAFDGSDALKYALCLHTACTEEEHLDNHIHFHCIKCGKTTCLEEVSTPKVELPNGFRVEEKHYLMKGLCDQCN